MKVFIVIHRILSVVIYHVDTHTDHHKNILNNRKHHPFTYTSQNYLGVAHFYCHKGRFHYQWQYTYPCDSSGLGCEHLFSAEYILYIIYLLSLFMIKQLFLLCEVCIELNNAARYGKTGWQQRTWLFIFRWNAEE